MDSALRVLIQQKLNDGRLPNNSIREFAVVPATETCLACERPCSGASL